MHETTPNQHLRVNPLRMFSNTEFGLEKKKKKKRLLLGNRVSHFPLPAYTDLLLKC